MTIYAYARQLNPATGDVVFDDTRSSWAEGHPAVEVAVRCLRTRKGSALRDKTYGLDLEGVDPSSEGAPAEIERRIRQALDRYVKSGLFSLESVQVEIQSEHIVAFLEIKDPRDVSGKPIPVKVVL